MANKDTPFGLKPVRHLSGAPWNGKVNAYYVVSTDSVANLFKGDTVITAGGADASGKYPTVDQGNAGAPLLGVIVGFGDNPHVMTHPDNPNRDYLPTATSGYVFVVDDPFVIFEVQEDNADNDLTAAMVGLTTDLTLDTSGSTSTGKSGMELDSSGTGTGAAQCRILHVSRREDNDLGSYCKWDVLIVEHEMLATIGI